MLEFNYENYRDRQKARKVGFEWNRTFRKTAQKTV